jgi:hypothetical protein
MPDAPSDHVERGRQMGIFDLQKTAATYRQLAIHKDNAHYAMAQSLERRHKLLGVPVIVTTTLVSAAIFSTLEAQAALGWKIATGLVSVTASVLAALQTFFNFADQAERHQLSARGYSQVRRRCELFDLRYRLDSEYDDALRDLGELAQQLDELEAHEPTIRDAVYKEIKRQYGG